jgi:hypothetical protein
VKQPNLGWTKDTKMIEIHLHLDHSVFQLKNKQLVISIDDVYKFDLLGTKFNGYAPSEVIISGKRRTVSFRLFDVGSFIPAGVDKNLFQEHKGTWQYKPKSEYVKNVPECDGYVLHIVNTRKS